MFPRAGGTVHTRSPDPKPDLLVLVSISAFVLAIGLIVFVTLGTLPGIH